MFDFLKKTMLSGVGIASLTKEKIEHLSEELVERGKITRSEGERLISEFLKKSSEAKKKLNAHIEQVVKSTLKKMDIATKADIRKLERNIRALEGRPQKKVLKKTAKK